MEKFKLAIINETDCIGCTKCIQACPFDAIIGAAQQIHTVLKTECTGCGLCVAPCPVDCITMTAVQKPLFDPARIKFHRQLHRERKETQETFAPIPENPLAAKKAILAAIERAREKNT